MRFRRRHGLLRACAVLVCVISSAAGQAGSAENESEAPVVVPSESRGAIAAEIGAKTFDVLVLRPIGAAAAVGGFGCFLILGPMAAASQGIGTVWDIFVLGPVDYTFERPLGDF